jgi:hypothetical protein
MGQLEQSGFKMMEDQAQSPDLVLCDFSLFGYVKGQSERRSLAEEGELLWVLPELESEIPPEMILRVVADWNRRLRLWLRKEREYVE